MSTVFDLLARVQQNPGMYLGYPSVNSLFMFLNGYEVARGEMGVELTAEEEVFYDDFQPWLQQKLGVHSVTSWAKLIMLSCHDERAGFDKFFELLGEFQQQRENVETNTGLMSA
ncbi:MAG: hypothetical protein AAFV72_25900 [Cyanobacteria bacterium J06635_1]